MKRIILILLLCAVTLEARQLWYSLTDRTFFMIEDGCVSVSPCGDPLDYFGRINQERYAAYERCTHSISRHRAERSTESRSGCDEWICLFEKVTKPHYSVTSSSLSRLAAIRSRASRERMMQPSDASPG